VRIVSYNVLDGGEGRADPLAEVIEAQRPDIVGLVEATNLSVSERIANRLGMDFVHGAGVTQGSALLSRWTIRDSINHALLQPGLSKSLLEATVIGPDAQPLSVGVLHLAHNATERDEQQRERELDIILNVFERHRQAQIPHVVLGDFNSNSPLQEIDPEKVKPSTRKAWEENGRQIPRRAIQKMLDAGYIDTLATAAPQAARHGATFTTQYPGQRVDYIFVYGIDPSRISAAWIEQDRLAKYASDHYPVGVQIL